MEMGSSTRPYDIQVILRDEFLFSTSSSGYDIYVISGKYKSSAISSRYDIYVIWFELNGAVGA